ncbi:MAG TPA: hypothetical protein DCG46_05210 [Gammaproteobacteria bacterium]|jgi:phage gp29-like protein|nr:hypothetical protein [Gammaproteobacteria bacterium]HAE05092.1 hypothetical protein [Gammaproteobacteria bacterium]HAE70984.1 hypothetical protein [Gammaproteobacteria bacterium]HAG48157.1 hypothetical protein [Gammaproteobacteria bacterium]HAN32963.1 hypothetical protein [Gammaproteobacteria bacterium]
MNLFGRHKKNVEYEKGEQNSKWNSDLKRNTVNTIGSSQQGFEFDENTDNKRPKDTLGNKKGLSINIDKITQDQVKILKNCAYENTAADLIKILKRSNKSKFKQAILKPLVDCGFFELTIPPILKDGKEKWSTSPKLKYRLTGKFVSKRSGH